MKRLTDKIKILMLLPLLTGCGEEDHSLVQGDDRQELLRLQSVRTCEGAPTRGGGTESPLLDTKVAVGFFVKELIQTTEGSTSTVYVTQNNVKGGYDVENKAWQPLPAQPVWLNNHRATLGVYAPYDASQSTAGDGALSLKADLYDKKKDLAAARFTADNRTATTTGLDITLKHLYVRLRFTFEKYSNYTATAAIAKMELTGDDIYQTATYSLFDDTTPYAIDQTTIGITQTFSPGLVIGTDAAADDAATIDLLMIPTGKVLTKDALLTITTTENDGTSEIEKILKIPISTSLFTGRPLTAGKQYNFKVKLSLSTVEIGESDIQTVDWEKAAENDMEANSKFD